MAKLSLIYGLSLAVHGAPAVSVALLKEPKRTETIAITMSDGPKKPAMRRSSPRPAAANP